MNKYEVLLMTPTDNRTFDILADAYTIYEDIITFINEVKIDEIICKETVALYPKKNLAITKIKKIY